MTTAPLELGEFQDARARLVALHVRKATAWLELARGELGGTHARLVALERVDGMIRRHLSIKSSPPTYRGIVGDLGDALAGHWALSEALVLEAADDVAEIVDRHGRAGVGTARVERRIAQLQAALEAKGIDATADPQLQDAIGRYMAAAYTLGQAEITRPIGWEVGWNLVDQDAIAGLSKSGLWWVGNHYGEALASGKLLAKVEDVIKSGQGRVEGGRLLREAFGAEFHRSDAYWRGLAATVATRSRTFGALGAMEATGAATYEYVNPLDERTSDVCRELDGTTFTVKGGAELRDRLLAADTPEAWKAIAPWPKVKDLDGPAGRLSPAELQAKGIAWPPLHFHCRSSIDVVTWSEIQPEDLGEVRRVEPAGPKPPRKPKAPPPEAEPPPPPPPPPVPRWKVIMGQKTGAAAGSNDGGFYTGQDGVRRYVKFYADPAQAAGEHLANRLYRDLGLGAARSELFKLEDGRLAYASEILDNDGTLAALFRGATAAERKAMATKALDGFAADILTANWDAAGLSMDNMVRLADGTIARIDNGAAFLTRAQGARKPAAALKAAKPEDWAAFFDRNPGYQELAKAADVTRGHDLANLADQVDRIVALRPAEGWAAYVGELEGLTAAETTEIVELLETRTAFLAAKAQDARDLAYLDQLERARPYQATAGHVAKAKTRAWSDGFKANRTAPGLPSGQLTPAEYRAMKAYTGSSYTTINNNLRAGRALTADDQLLEDAIIRSQLPEDVVLWRGVSPCKPLTDLVKDGARSEGNVDADRAFASAACFREVSSDWAGNGPRGSSSGDPVVFRILARRGTPAMYVDDISSNSGEMEFLIPVGGRLKVIRSTWVKGSSSWGGPNDGHWEVDTVLEVPGAPPPPVQPKPKRTRKPPTT